jgi:hypothetical protein
MMLPEATLSFTLPSLQDGTILDCRVYHPLSLAPSLKPTIWKRHAAIVAHPYAPLGGCSDDSVVEIITEALLSLGYLVGTFNFRYDSSTAPSRPAFNFARPGAPDTRPVVHHGPRNRNDMTICRSLASYSTIHISLTHIIISHYVKAPGRPQRATYLVPMRRRSSQWIGLPSS